MVISFSKEMEMSPNDCGCSQKDVESSTEKIDTILTVLSDQFRRQILYSAVERDDEVIQYPEVVDYLIDCNSGMGHDDRERIKIKLHHSSLPRLEETGVIEHDSRSETIRYCGDSLLEKYITLLAEDEFD